MEWPGYERQKSSQTTDKSKDEGRRKEHHLESSFWRWPHLEHGSIGRGTLVPKGRRVQWSSVIDTPHNRRWLPSGRPTKVFPETRSPQVDILDHSARQRAEKGLQYLRTYFPDVELPGELLGNTLESDAKEMHRLKEFNPYLGNLLEIIPSHHTENEPTVVFPMGELGRELNISRFNSDRLGNMVFDPTGSPSLAFETPILQISSAVGSSEWIATPSSAILIRTYTSSSLLRLEHSTITRELEITRSEAGDIPIVDSRILASGPDIVVVNRSGKVYKCTTYRGSKAMQLIGVPEASSDDHFWQLGITGRDDECFLASCKAVKHIDLRSPSSVVDVFSLDHPTAIVTSFESPMRDYIGHITTTSDVIWLDHRFPRRPLLSFRHYRSPDRTLRLITANFSDGGSPLSLQTTRSSVSEASVSLLTSRRNGFVTMYDVSRDSGGLLHCNSTPSCLPRDGPMFTACDGHALVMLPSDKEMTFLRLCQRGSIYRQDIRATEPDEDQPVSAQEDHDSHRWDADVLTLERQINELQIDFGPAGGRHYTEVNLRSAYEEIFAATEDTEDTDQGVCSDALAQLSDIWQDAEETAENMLTTFDVISRIEGGNGHTSHMNFFAGGNSDPERVLDASKRSHPAIQKLTDLAQWHYNIQATSIPGLIHHSADCSGFHEHLKELNLVSGAEKHDTSARRETEARKQLVADLALSNDVYSVRPGPYTSRRLSAAGEATSNAAGHPTEISYSEEPPEVSFGYFHPVRKSGADHYADKDRDGEQGSGVSSPLGIRLLLAEWALGADPKDYTYRDPYGLEDRDAQPVPQYRRLPSALPITQRKQAPPQRPPLVATAAAQPPVVHTVEHAPAMVQSQTVQHAHSQQSEPGFEASSQQPMASTQTLPGPFGGRPGGKKPGKKRIGGF